jgi:hypothetical protein
MNAQRRFKPCTHCIIIDQVVRVHWIFEHEEYKKGLIMMHTSSSLQE